MTLTNLHDFYQPLSKITFNLHDFDQLQARKTSCNGVPRSIHHEHVGHQHSPASCGCGE